MSPRLPRGAVGIEICIREGKGSGPNSIYARGRFAGFLSAVRLAGVISDEEYERLHHWNTAPIHGLPDYTT